LSFWRELRRRNVFTAGAAYAVVAWLLVQVAAVVLPAFEAPTWIFRGFLVLVAVGFVITVVLAWIYDVTSEGIKRTGAATDETSPPEPLRARKAEFAAIGALSLIVVALVFDRYTATSRDRPEEIRTPATVLIADFANRTGEDVFDGTLPPVVRLTLEAAGFITAFDRTQLRTLGVQPVAGVFDEQAARKIAVSQGLGNVISGTLERRGNQYSVSMRTIEAVTGDTVEEEDETVDKDQVLLATTRLASSVRKALGDDTSDSALRFAGATLSTASLEAVHEYASAANALSNAKYEDALASFSRAIDIDDNFGLAYAGMAVASSALGQRQAADEYIRLANTHLDGMSERERYSTRGFYFALTGDAEKCVEEYTIVIKRFPSSVAAHNNLAFCLSDLRRISEALSEARQATAILPKRLTYRLNVALFSSYGGDFQTGEKEARAALEMDPSAVFGLVALALAQMGRGDSAAAAQTYAKLEDLGSVGASFAHAGLADIALYEGRFADAVRILEDGAREDTAAQAPDRAAEKLVHIAHAHLLQARESEALAAAEDALALSMAPAIRFLAGRVFAAAGETGRAEAIAANLAEELDPEARANAKLIEGEIALTDGDARRAVVLFRDAKNLLDTWIARFSLGKAYVEAGLFTEADSELDVAIQRRGEALSLFLDQYPTYGYFPAVYYYLGRARQGQNSRGFADSYERYLSIREKAGEDPLLPEVRERAGL
jgi:tetratricopeptide (TPR) repeat protein